MLEEAELYDLEREQEEQRQQALQDAEIQVGSNPKSKPSL